MQPTIGFVKSIEEFASIARNADLNVQWAMPFIPRISLSDSYIFKFQLLCVSFPGMRSSYQFCCPVKCTTGLCDILNKESFIEIYRLLPVLVNI